MKLHQKLDKDMPHYKGGYSEEKCAILEKDVELLWKKVRVHEYYGDIERNLRNMAVDELTKIKDKLREGNKSEEGDIRPNPNKEWRTVWKEREGSRSIESGWVEKEETPKITMIRVQSSE